MSRWTLSTGEPRSRKGTRASIASHGLQQVQTRPYRLEYRAGTSEGQHVAEDVRLTFQTLMPFLRKWARVPDNYEENCQQAVREMQLPDFVAPWNLLTAWGMRSPGKV